jgi:hypothetical protein
MNRQVRRTLRVLLTVAGVFVILAILVRWGVRDPYPDYEKNLSLKDNLPGSIHTGFAAIKITPDIIDTWEDVNGDYQFTPGKGDTWEDRNNNGIFDAVWIAGFQNKRAARKIHDDLWARAVVIDNGSKRIALVAVDGIGLFHEDVVTIREKVASQASIDYTAVSATHTHSGPDFLGLWGKNRLKSGINEQYKSEVLEKTARAIVQASRNLRPSYLVFSVNDSEAAPLVEDTRPPEVHDHALKIMQARDARKDSTLGTLVVWGCHPETTWNDHMQISSDFPHYLRKYLEEGIYKADSNIFSGFGGIALFIPGAIGGLMSTTPEVTVTDPVTGKSFTEPSFEKAEAQGKQLALMVKNSLEQSADTVKKTTLNLQTRTFTLPMENPYFQLAAVLGIIKQGFNGWGKHRTEMAAFTLGNASFLTFPGEVYPEIVYGGIEAPKGQDFPVQPVEVPPLDDLMPGKYHFFLGLTNDEVGYIIPKSEWDEDKPYLYGSEDEHYGEVNSPGPETGMIVHSKAVELLEDLEE